MSAPVLLVLWLLCVANLAFPCSQKHGFDNVYPALATISDREEFTIGKRGASDGWSYINASLLIAGPYIFSFIDVGVLVEPEIDVSFT